VLKLAFASFFLATASLPLWSRGGYLTGSTLLFMLGAMFLGIHAANHAPALSGGSSILRGFYRATPLLLPMSVMAVRTVALGMSGD